jgi:hypothetical protein
MLLLGSGLNGEQQVGQGWNIGESKPMHSIHGRGQLQFARYYALVEEWV